MDEKNCKQCIWLDICLNKENDDPCEDYFQSEEDHFIRHLSNERKEYQKEWDKYINEAD